MKNSDHNTLPPGRQGIPSKRSDKITARESVKRGFRIIAWQAAVLVALSILFAAFDLDRLISAQFYDSETRWAMGKQWLWTRMYRYGTIPGILLALGCLAGWLISFFNKRLLDWRPYFLLVVLTTVLAAGFLVNGVLKSYWGRPRPNQITDFGGFYTYRHVLPPGTPGKGASFPCGHCTMGFTFLSLYFVKRRSKVIAYSGTAAGIILGSLLSAARIINGAHFMTDAIWSMGLVSMTAVALYYCMLKVPARGTASKWTARSPRQKIVLITAACVVALLITGAFMSRRPFYKTLEYAPPVRPETQRMVVEINTEPEKLVVGYQNRASTALLIHAHGFGWAYVDYHIERQFKHDGDTLLATIRIEPRSYFAELDHTVEVVLPKEQEHRLKVLVNPDKKAAR